MIDLGHSRPRVIVAVLASLFVLALLVAPASAVQARGGAQADFALNVNYKPPNFVGHVVRGAIPSTPCGVCNGQALPQPAYFVPSSFGPFFDWNSIGLVSLNDFRGSVTLEVLNLPVGVTSLTGTTLTVPRRGAVSTPFKLQAASAAALGGATVTVRATSGTLVHTFDLPITVADQPDLSISPPSVVGGNQAVGGVLTLAVEADSVVGLSSSDPAVAQVPAGVTIRAGSASAVFAVTTFSVAAPTTVNITASFGGASASLPLTVTPAPPPPPPAPADSIGVKVAEYDSAKQVLRAEATSTSSSATLTVSVTASGQVIDTLTNAGGGTYKGEFAWPVNPENITVKSNLGGSATSPVTAK